MSHENLTGQTFGQYELRDLLGMGGMGTVYRAYQANLKRVVAIKILPSNLAFQAGYIERFNREAQTAAALEHPHIVPILDYGTQRGTSFVVMRLLGGHTLAQRLAERTSSGILPALGEVSDLLNQLASALDYAHNQGVLHRDIKPSNVMFDNQGNAYLVDFGIAKLLDGTSNLTSTGMAMGTPSYMAPEQWRGEALTPSTDQYALGIMVYAMVTGRVPFEAATPYALMHKHLNEEVTPAQVLRVGLPEAVMTVLRRAMAKDPDARFPTVTAFAQAFSHAVVGAEGKATGFSTFSLRFNPIQNALMTPSNGKQSRSTENITMKAALSRRSLVWGISLIVILLLALLAFLIFPSNKDLSIEQRVNATLTAAQAALVTTLSSNDVTTNAMVILATYTPTESLTATSMPLLSTDQTLTTPVVLVFPTASSTASATSNVTSTNTQDIDATASVIVLQTYDMATSAKLQLEVQSTATQAILNLRETAMQWTPIPTNTLPSTSTSIPAFTPTPSLAATTNSQQDCALQFNGNSTYVSVPNQRNFDFSRQFTVEAWVKPLHIDNSQTFHGIVQGAFTEPPFSGSGWVLFIQNYAWGLSVCTPACNAAQTTLQINQWQHIAATFDGNNIIIYKDGIEVGRAPQSGNVMLSNYILIGIWEKAFDGLIDEVRLWNFALTPAAIASDKNKILTGSETGLVGYWRFNECAGQSVYSLTSDHQEGLLKSTDGVPNQMWAGSDLPIKDNSRISSTVSASPTVEVILTASPMPILIPTPVNMQNPYVTIQVQSTNLRNGPGEEYTFAAVPTVYKGAIFLIIAQDYNNGWYLVQLPDGRRGWINSRDVSISPDNVFIEPAATIPAPPPTSLPATIVPTMGTQSAYAIVQVQSTDLRKGPGEEYTFAAFPTVYKGANFLIIAQAHNNDWYLVQLADGRRGWVNSRDVSIWPSNVFIEPAATIPAPPPTSLPATIVPTMGTQSAYATIQVSSANLRKGPGKEYNFITTAKRGDAFLIVAQAYNSSWYLVKLTDGRLAWVSSSVVAISPSNYLIPAVATIPAPPIVPVASTRPVINSISIDGTCSGFTYVISWSDPDGNASLIKFSNLDGLHPASIAGGSGTYRWDGLSCHFDTCNDNFTIEDQSGQSSTKQGPDIQCH